MMTMDSVQSPAAEVEAVLRELAPDLLTIGPTKWAYTLSCGGLKHVTVWLDEEWLIWDATLGDHAGRETSRQDENRRWLRLNAFLPSPCKCIVEPKDRSVRLRAEHLLATDTQRHDLIELAFAQYATAVGRWISCADSLQLDDQRAYDPADSGVANIDAVKSLCVEAGWSFNERAAGSLAIPLEVREAFHQAELRRTGESLRLFTEMAVLDSAAHASSEAISFLLLVTAGFLRVVRASALSRDEKMVYGLEVSIPMTPSREEYADDLAAMSVACDLCGREIEALQDERIARQYLEMRGL